MVTDGAVRRVLITGGAGFIGSALCRSMVRNGHHVVNVDCLTYSGNRASLREVEKRPNYRFYKADIGDSTVIAEILARERIDWIAHLAAETHVDRSIDGPAAFVATNIVGTSRLLEAARAYFEQLSETAKARFRFLQVSTDEVFGDLSPGCDPFGECSPYRPSSPYAASKAAADHLVRAWHRTYGLPVLLSNCSNNYGPFQFPEKLIPVAILNLLHGRSVPVYGDGRQVRDWLHVDDHVRAIQLILAEGRIGESYMVGARAERTNLAVIETICDLLDRERPGADGRCHRDLIRFVEDRPGHDLRYAVDPAKIERELGWRPARSFSFGLEHTVSWYLENECWWGPLRAEAGVRHGTGR
jgi:dTDP-glucose 4,6-dehydratase